MPVTKKPYTIRVDDTIILLEADKFIHRDQFSRFECYDEDGHFQRSIEIHGPHEVRDF